MIFRNVRSQLLTPLETLGSQTRTSLPSPPLHKRLPAYGNPREGQKAGEKATILPTYLSNTEAMKKHTRTVLSTMLGVLVFTSATNAETSNARARMEMAFSCNGNARPTEVISWIEELGGGAIVGSSQAQGGTEYTIPNPIYVLGFRATHYSIRSMHGAERNFDVYETIFPDTPFRSIASIAGLSADEAGNYHQRVGKNHLFLREQAGVTYVTCAMHVHASGLERALRKKEDPRAKEEEHAKE